MGYPSSEVDAVGDRESKKRTRIGRGGVLGCVRGGPLMNVFGGQIRIAFAPLNEALGNMDASHSTSTPYDPLASLFQAARPYSNGPKLEPKPARKPPTCRLHPRSSMKQWQVYNQESENYLRSFWRCEEMPRGRKQCPTFIWDDDSWASKQDGVLLNFSSAVEQPPSTLPPPPAAACASPTFLEDLPDAALLEVLERVEQERQISSSSACSTPPPTYLVLPSTPPPNQIVPLALPPMLSSLQHVPSSQRKRPRTPSPPPPPPPRPQPQLLPSPFPPPPLPQPQLPLLRSNPPLFQPSNPSPLLPLPPPPPLPPPADDEPMALSDPSTVVDDRDWWLGIDDLTGPQATPAAVPPPAAPVATPVAAPVALGGSQLPVCVSSPPFGSHTPCAAVAPASASAAGISGCISGISGISGISASAAGISGAPPANFTASASVAASPLVDASASVEVTAAAPARGESRSRAAEADAHLSVRAALGTGGCGLHRSVVAAYEELGVHRLYPWQHACLLGTEGVLDGRNLVYSTPTSGGKSLVADVLLCRTLQRRQKGLLVLPYVSMVEEVTERLTRLLRSLPTTGRRAGRPGAAGKLRVEASHGARSRNGFDGDVDLLVCTIERASAVVHRMLEMPEGLRELGIVVVDEVHMLADPSRGHAIENLLTLLRAQRHKLAVHTARHPASSASALAGGSPSTGSWATLVTKWPRAASSSPSR